MKKKYYECLGCFTIYDHKPGNVCCEKYPNHPYAMDRVKKENYIEYLKRERG